MRGASSFAATAALAGLALAAAQARAADCPVTGAALVPYLERYGFGSETNPVDGQSATCTASWPAVTVGAPAEAKGGCVVTFFKGAKLPDGWKRKSYNIVGLPYRRVTPSSAAATLEIDIVATAPAGESDNVSLGTVVFTGSDCNTLMNDLAGQ